MGDLAALQGAWRQIGLEVDGVVDPPDELTTPGALTTISGHHFAVHAADGALLLEGNFTLDDFCDPKAVDWTDTMGPDMGKALPAIYRLEKDHFVFVAADHGAPRPTEFRTRQGQTMRSFVRSANRRQDKS